MGIEKLLRLRLLVGVVLSQARRPSGGRARRGADEGLGRSDRSCDRRRWAVRGRTAAAGCALRDRGKRRKQLRGGNWDVSRFFLVSDEERAREDAREEEDGSKDKDDRTVPKRCRRAAAGD